MGWPIDMERKGCESIGCYIYFVTFNVHLTHDLDLGFSRSNFENYLRNGMADWHGTKAMWIDRMLHPLCDFQHSPHPWPWPWIFEVKFWKSHISGMGWPIDMERKGCESIGCYTHFLTLNVHFTHGLDLGFSRSNFENAVSQEWEGRLTWNERDLSRQNVGPMLWLSMFTSSMTLTLDFQGQILKKSNLRNGLADWHGTKGMWVDRMLDSHCDFKLWPHPWPWPWIFKVKYWNCCNYIPRIRRIGGCYGFTSKPPAARRPPPATRRPPPAMVLTR